MNEHKEKYSQKIFEILTTPNEFDEVNQELINWFEMLLENKRSNEKLFIKYLKKYPWLVAHTNNYNEIVKYYNNKFSITQKNIDIMFYEVKEMVGKKKCLGNIQKMLLARFDNNEAKHLSWLFQKFAVERMKLKGGWAGSDFLYLPLYLEILRRTKINPKDLYETYRINDVIDSIHSGGPALLKKEINNRKKAFVLWLKEGELYFYSGAKAEEVIKNELKGSAQDGESRSQKDVSLKGQVASKGKAVGRVRVAIPGNLSILKDIQTKFKEGEVLVTTMTQPNMVPIMKKAAAVVTDEGGLTSHAAIIAREFGIPCIVGTHISTKVLKNGDEVLVDANEGVVKKI